MGVCVAKWITSSYRCRLESHQWIWIIWRQEAIKIASDDYSCLKCCNNARMGTWGFPPRVKAGKSYIMTFTKQNTIYINVAFHFIIVFLFLLQSLIILLKMTFFHLMKYNYLDISSTDERNLINDPYIKTVCLTMCQNYNAYILNFHYYITFKSDCFCHIFFHLSILFYFILF